MRRSPCTTATRRRGGRGRGRAPRPHHWGRGHAMHQLTRFDLWLTTDPREAEDAAWEAYADAYHDRAVHIVIDFIVDTLPTRETDPTDRQTLLAALTRLVDGQDAELITRWAGELSD